jgi:hypothetical protein
MTAMAALRELMDTQARIVPLTAEQYHGMIEHGLLPEGEPIELLDGFLVRKDRSKAGEDAMTVGHGHAAAVDAITELAGDVKALGGCLRIQQPVTLPPDDEPEPDASFVTGPSSRYRGRLPGPQDISCVVEVADSSLNKDRTTKQRIYADHGIGQYLIVNLIDQVIEEYRSPSAGRYQIMRSYGRGDTISIDVAEGRQLSIPVASLLP